MPFFLSETKAFCRKISADNQLITSTLAIVGMTRFELATPRPPDAYSKPTELHPDRTISRFLPKSDAKLLLFLLTCKCFDKKVQKKDIYGVFCGFLRVK